MRQQLLAAGVLGGVAFVVWELHHRQPLLDPRLFRLRGFSTGTLSVTGQFFAAFGFFYIILQYLQYVADLSPLQSAIALLPMPFVLLPLARQSPKLALRFGANRIAGLGLLLSATGLLMMNLLAVDLVYWQLAAALVVFTAGMALASTPATMAITSSLPRAKQGVGSAVNDVSREFGSALGIAILGSALNQVYSNNLADAVHGLPASAAEAARSSVAAVQQMAPQLGDQGAALLQAGKQAFVDATGVAFIVAAIVMAACAVVVFLLAPSAHDLQETQDADDPAPVAG